MLATKRIVCSVLSVSMLFSSISNSAVFAADLYVDLHKENGNYTYSKISNNSIGEYPVNLNTMSLNYSKDKASCFNFVFGLVGDCKDSDDFYKSHIDFRLTLTAWLATMLLMPTFTLFGMGGEKDVFDSDAFAKANSDAIVNSKINKEEIINKYNKYLEDTNKISGDYSNYTYNKANELLNNYENRYNTFFSGIHFDAKVNDKSGLYNKDLSIDRILSNVIIEHVRINKFNLDKKDYSHQIEAPVAEFPSMLNDFTKQAKQDYSKDIDQFNNSINVYENQLKDSIQNTKISHTSYLNIDGYNIGIDVQDNVQYSQSTNTKLPVKITIDSRNYTHVFPPYKHEDNNLKLYFNGETIEFVNKTKNYLEIKSITIYYNNNITNHSYDKSIELPPNTYKNGFNINNYVNNEIINDSNYESVTANSAKKSNFNFGFAVKYRIVEQNVDKTLYNTNAYNLYKVLVAKK